MILYEKRFGAFNLLFRLYGSQWPRAAILALPGAILAALIRAFVRPQPDDGYYFLHPYPYSIFATILAFIILFRTNLSYQRFWEGRTMMALMSEKWTGATIQVLSFDEASKEPAASSGYLFRAEFVHVISLLHSVAIQRLRGDSDLSNFSKASFTETRDLPPVDPSYLTEWVKYRAKTSYLILRAKEQHYEKFWSSQPLPVIGGMNETERSIIMGDENPVYLVYSWIHRMLVDRRAQGGLDVGPSIVSRVYAMLSDGMLAFENAKKIVDTPFPFPYAQCCALLLHINSLGLPLLVANYVGSTWLTSLVTFFSTFAYYLINEVAREIEEPFKFDPNEIPVTNLHCKFNNDLVIAFAKGLIPVKGLFSHINEMDIKLQIAKARPITICKEQEKSQPPSSDAVEGSKKEPSRWPRTSMQKQEKGPRPTNMV